MSQGRNRRENSKLLSSLSTTGKSVSVIVGEKLLRGRVAYLSNSSPSRSFNYYLIDDEGRKVRHLYARDVTQSVHGNELAISVIGLDNSYRKNKRIISI